MPSTDSNVIDTAMSPSFNSIDQVNKTFYESYPYPWRPGYVDASLDEDLERKMLNQNIGDWTHDTVPKGARIWVAGCGTSQAALTALRFPGTRVLGSDLSEHSLELCRSMAKDLGLVNLELRRESINEATYQSEFDYILCTGVIHHNAEPAITLQKLARALVPTGILEVMVYNKYHRVLTSAFQGAIRILAGRARAPGCQTEVAMARELIAQFPLEGLMGRMLASYRLAHDVEMADALLQPVENSYSLEELTAMAQSCGLQLILPAPNAVDAGTGKSGWHLQFQQEAMRNAYGGLDDIRRWQVTNHLLCEKSPLLWFYFRHMDCPMARQTEAEICDSFMNCRFITPSSARKAYVLEGERGYRISQTAVEFPSPPSLPQLSHVINAANSGLTMGQIFAQLGIADTFETRNEMRLALTTSIHPHLVAIVWPTRD